MAGWMRMPLATDVGLGPGDIVLGGDPAPPYGKGHRLVSQQPLLFSPLL